MASAVELASAVTAPGPRGGVVALAPPPSAWPRRQSDHPGVPRGRSLSEAARFHRQQDRPALGGATAASAVEVPRETWTGTAGQPRLPSRGLPRLDPDLRAQPTGPFRKRSRPPECSTAFAEPRPLRPVKADRLPPCYRPPCLFGWRKSGSILRHSPPRRWRVRPWRRVPSSGPRSIHSAADRAQVGLNPNDVPRRRRPGDPCPSARPAGDATSPGPDICSRAN